MEKINRSLEGGSSSQPTFRDSSMINWITLKFFDQNKEIEYYESKIKEIVANLRKTLIVCAVFCAIELVKEIILYGFKKIPFNSFYYYFGLLVLFAIMGVSTYKCQRCVHILTPIQLSIICIYFCFFYLYV